MSDARFLLRFDDLCPTMNWAMWDAIEAHLVRMEVRPILAVVPDNRDPKLVAGPPKRFAQGIGVVFSTTALILWFGFGLSTATWVVVGLLACAATLESVFGICLGCIAFGYLMKAGVIPEEVCAACADISLRHPQLSKS